MIHFRSSHRIRERAGHAPEYLALDIRLPTLIEYRKSGIGPDFAVVGRTILYSRAHFQTWLENGGTRAFTGNEPAPEQAPEQPMGRRGARDAPSVNGPTGHRAGPHHQPRGERDDGYQPS